MQDQMQQLRDTVAEMNCFIGARNWSRGRELAEQALALPIPESNVAFGFLLLCDLRIEGANGKRQDWLDQRYRDYTVRVQPDAKGLMSACIGLSQAFEGERQSLRFLEQIEAEEKLNDPEFMDSPYAKPLFVRYHRYCVKYERLERALFLRGKLREIPAAPREEVLNCKLVTAIDTYAFDQGDLEFIELNSELPNGNAYLRLRLEAKGGRKVDIQIPFPGNDGICDEGQVGVRGCDADFSFTIMRHEVEETAEVSPWHLEVHSKDEEQGVEFILNIANYQVLLNSQK